MNGKIGENSERRGIRKRIIMQEGLKKIEKEEV